MLYFYLQLEEGIKKNSIMFSKSKNIRVLLLFKINNKWVLLTSALRAMVKEAFNASI
jgi:hypothetical protein